MMKQKAFDTIQPALLVDALYQLLTVPAVPLLQNLIYKNVQYNVYHYQPNPMLTLYYLFQSVIIHNVKSGMYMLWFEFFFFWFNFF